MPSKQLAVGRRVTVEVPATSANLGPGFDCFGLALDWRERIELVALESGFVIDVSGEGAEEIPRDESHLIIRSALVGLADLGVRAAGLRLSGHNTIPHGRGLGSSSAAIVAGLVAAAGLAGAELDRAWLLRHATAIEGHPDNVAAAIYGGFVLAYEGPAGVTMAQGRLDPAVGVAVLVPDFPVGTAAARRLLPDTVPHDEAAANSGRAGLLVHALATDPDRLHDATRDWLHQHYREPAMPRSYQLMTSLRSQGFAAMISGAGPAVLVLGRADRLAGLAAVRTPGFHVRLSAVGLPASLAVTDLS
ncbi:MAG TPA: homoserine kinase [Propionibacteriaceae bacterium]|nr:homoserine kinase [Propionibacteriaceae bacterium]